MALADRTESTGHGTRLTEGVYIHHFLRICRIWKNFAVSVTAYISHQLTEDNLLRPLFAAPSLIVVVEVYLSILLNCEKILVIIIK